jgi:hypothetical protein
MNILYSAVNQPSAVGKENASREIIIWIQECNVVGDGRGAVLAFKRHFDGEAATSNCEVLSRAKIEHLNYRDKSVFSFDRFMLELKDAFDSCSVDYLEQLKILDKIQRMSRSADIATIKHLAWEKNFDRFEKCYVYEFEDCQDLHGSDCSFA